MLSAMTIDELKARLSEIGAKFVEEDIQHGKRLRGPEGELFCVFDSGTFLLQGKATALARSVEEWAKGGAGVPAQAAAPAPVFIVYGHDTAVRDNLELLLRRMGLEPIVLGNMPAKGDTIIEKLEHYIGEHGHAGFACVLLTPDDEGNKVGETEKKKYRARQNVVLELGMVLASLGRQRVAILYKQSVELPSDISGLIYVPFQEKVDEVKAQLFKELQAAGYTPNAAGL